MFRQKFHLEALATCKKRILIDMNKTVLLTLATIFGIAFAYIPSLFGDHDLFSAWSILLSVVGGLVGIVVGVWVSKRWF